MSIKVGDKLPEGTLSHVPYDPEVDSLTACGTAVTLSTEEWKGKKVVLFAVPGAFTPTCHATHLPGYLDKYPQLKEKGVDIVAVIASNDAFVMSGWGKSLGVKDKILCLSDANAVWSGAMGLAMDTGPNTFTRTKRYAMILDDLVVKYLGVEPAKGVTVASADQVLLHL